jgi:hypothetical protein
MHMDTSNMSCRTLTMSRVTCIMSRMHRKGLVLSIENYTNVQRDIYHVQGDVYHDMEALFKSLGIMFVDTFTLSGNIYYGYGDFYHVLSAFG